MKLIYEPGGRAREYSPLALNIYDGCNHGCAYCYVPRIRQIDRGLFRGRLGYLAKYSEAALRSDAEKMRGSPLQVLLSFTSDPYCAANQKENGTRKALNILSENKVMVAVLSKAGKRMLSDRDDFHAFGDHIKVGATLTFQDWEKSAKWEPGAASPESRKECLSILHDEGIITWASFEPVIEPDESLAMIRDTLEYVDEYRLGKLNNYQGMDIGKDWAGYLREALSILRNAGKAIYVKKDLRDVTKSVTLEPSEMIADKTIQTPWPTASQNQLFTEGA